MLTIRRVALATSSFLTLVGCTGNIKPSHCDDRVLDGDETDVDCGGSCGECDTRCTTRDDCAEGTCVDGTCSLICDNGVQDPGETDVDCGGDTCHSCAGAQHCEVAGDCASGSCVAGACSAIAVSFAAPVFYEVRLQAVRPAVCRSRRRR